MDSPLDETSICLTFSAALDLLKTEHELSDNGEAKMRAILNEVRHCGISLKLVQPANSTLCRNFSQLSPPKLMTSVHSRCKAALIPSIPFPAPGPQALQLPMRLAVLTPCSSFSAEGSH